MTGLIYAAIAIAWLAYLVPWFLRKRANEDEKTGVDPRIQLRGVKIIRDVEPDDDEETSQVTADVSTPLTRRAMVYELRRSEAVAAARRRHVLVFLMVVTTAVAVGIVAGYLLWWSIFIPVALLVAFVVVARFSVKAMRKNLDRRYEQIMNRGNNESTVLIGRKEAEQKASEEPEPDEHSLPVSPDSAGNVWEPLPVTRPTYVSRPLAPRTVRTIDLSSPELTESLRRPNDQLPVTAEPLGEIAEDSCPIDLRPAVGE
ncbi:divisome protein SepX/GlpR [Enemella sp. A6]|uniref:divisome protein SepX/GlpR n=1 Tax=Enemella sp. A6 TaxID=3440152 RepID=UPI003EBC6F24